MTPRRSIAVLGVRLSILSTLSALGCGGSSGPGAQLGTGGTIAGAGGAGTGGATSGTGGAPGTGGTVIVGGMGGHKTGIGGSDGGGMGGGGDAAVDGGADGASGDAARDTAGDAAGRFTVSGRVTYDFVPSTYDPTTRTGGLQFNRAAQRPVRNGVVEVVQGNLVLATATTGADGSYQLAFTPGGAGALTLIALAQTATPSIQVQDNTDGKLIWAIGRTIAAATATEDLRATHGWTGASYDVQTRTAAPFAILDSMYTAATAFTAVRPAQFPPLHVNWSPSNVPQGGDKAAGLIGTSHFAPDDGEIYVLGKDGVDTDEFDAHVIVHEWGHYFERNLSRSDSSGGRHGPGDVLDPRIAFSEAWGNSVASMVLPESVYADTSWSNGVMSSFGFDAETEPDPTDDPTPSAFSESSVLRLLYDLWDPANETFDRVALGLGPIYDALVGGQRSTDALTTLASFITALKAGPGVNAAAVDQLLAAYQIGPIVSEWGEGDDALSGMYTYASPLPFSGAIGLGGGFPFNSWQQNQYYVFDGTGGRVTVSATAVPDVAIAAYRNGVMVGMSDATTSGAETFTLATTQAGARYVVVLTGFGATPGDYYVTISIR